MFHSHPIIFFFSFCSDCRGTALSPETEFHDPRDRDMRSEFSSDSIEHSDIPLSPERQFDRQQLQWLEDLKNRRAKIVQVVYPRTANNEKELTVIRGEILEVFLLFSLFIFLTKDPSADVTLKKKVLHL